MESWLVVGASAGDQGFLMSGIGSGLAGGRLTGFLGGRGEPTA